MQFRVIDRETGREVSAKVKYDIASKNGLLWMDIDQFYCGEDGDLLLMDDCGNYAICDSERFIVEVLDELKMQDVVKRKEGMPREEYEPLYNCENWIP